MIRSLRFPTAALFAAAFFLFAGAERAFSYAACPHHGIPAPVESPAHAGHHDDTAPTDHAGPCTCLGQCQAGSPASTHTSSQLAAAAQGDLGCSAVSPSDAPRRRLAPHTLPFATAPPQLS